MGLYKDFMNDIRRDVMNELDNRIRKYKTDNEIIISDESEEIDDPVLKELTNFRNWIIKNILY